MKKHTVKILKSVWYVKNLYNSCHIAAYSAQAAYFMLLSFVPLAMLVLIVFAAFVPFDFLRFEQLLSRVLSKPLSHTVLHIFTDIGRNLSVSVLSLAFVFVVWAATKGVRSIASGVNVIYRSEEKYNTVQTGIRSMIYTFAMLGVIFISLTAAAAVPRLQIITLKVAGENLNVFIGAGGAIAFFTLVLLFASAYKALAKSGIGFKGQLPGAIFAAGGWVLYSAGYSVYIRYFSGYQALYGSFGAVMLFMLWLYMCMNILLSGALINRVLYDRQNRKCD